jgi:hypothetical protein
MLINPVGRLGRSAAVLRDLEVPSSGGLLEAIKALAKLATLLIDYGVSS